LDKPVRDFQGAAEERPNMSSEACQAFCGESGFRFAATEYGSQCFCGNSYGKYGQLPASRCDMDCSGNPSEKCGGTWASSVYEVGGIEATQQKPSAGPFATQAKVTVKWQGAVIPLKREEQIAFMFVQAINSMEDSCGRHAAEPCTLDALIRGPKSKDKWPLEKLKFDPNSTDPNYSYKVALEGDRWQVWANPRKPGLGGFYNKGAFFGGTWYNPTGPATEKDKKITESAIEGDLFVGD
jgi:WSC domain-containing protein